MESSKDTLAELADRAQDRILRLDNQLNFLRAKQDNLKKETEAIDIDLTAVRQEKIKKAMELQIAEKDLEDVEEDYNRFLTKQKALADKFDPLPEEATPSPQVETMKPQLFRPLSEGDVEDTYPVVLQEQTKIGKTFEGSSFGENDENAPIQRLVRN